MRLRGLFLLLAGLWSAGISNAQLFPISLRVQQGDQVATVANGANLSIGADAIGLPVTLTLTATYRGATQATMSVGPELVGSPSFSLVSQPTFPTTLHPADSVTFEIRFTPSVSSAVSAQFGLVFAETPAVGTQPVVGFITLNLSGAAPDLVVSYFFAADANVLALTSGSQLLFPPTPVNTSTTATVSVTNRGSAPGSVNSISVNGLSFQALGIPLLPGTLSAGQELRFAIRYSPKEIQTNTGTVDISFSGDRKVSAGLEASSTGPRLIYELLQGADVTPVLPNGSIPLSDTQVGETSNISMQVRNTGNGEGVIASLGVSGQGFRITDSAFFPQTLNPDGVTIFTIEFAPTTPGQVRGRLRVGNDTFELTARAIGSRLTFSYGAGSEVVPVLPGGGVFFSPLQSGQTARVNFSVKNNGTAPASISSIGVTEPRSAFSVEGLPGLPVSLAAGETVGFAIKFTPSSAGFTTGTLRLDGLTFALSGSASAPPPLPAYRITGPSGNIDALQQPAVGLTLDAPYPFDLTGVLTLIPEPEGFFADPAVQFATGGRTVNFTIPANSTQATFANSSRQIRLQTGTVAGAITLTPTFAISGPVDVTPSSPATLRMTVAATAPRLLGAQLASRTATGVVILITGYTTTRSLTQLDFEFTPVPGFNLPTTRVSVNISGASQLWFGGALSQGFGGQFTVSVPFNLRADLTLTPADGLLRASITASNERGASNAVLAELQ